jgi:hypothetical protein
MTGDGGIKTQESKIKEAPMVTVQIELLLGAEDGVRGMKRSDAAA